MKKLAVIFLLFLCLGIPCAAKGQVNQAPLKLSYCEWLDESKNHDGRLIETQAIMVESNVPRVDGGDTSLYSPACNNKDFFSVTNFSALKDAKRWRKFFDSFKEEKVYLFEIKFTGRRRSSFLLNFGHLGWTRNEIIIETIQSLKEITTNPETVQPDTETVAPLNERAKNLFNDTYLFLSYLNDFDNDRESLGRILSDDFKLIDLAGKSLSKADFIKLISPPLTHAKELNTTEYKIEDTKKVNDEMIVASTIKFNYRDGKIRLIKCENSMRLDGNRWRVVRAKISEIN